MAHNFYITITGQKQGAIKGDVTLKGHEGAILGLALSHEIISPRDPQSGLPTGKRMHKPMKITTPWGSATPRLLNSLYTNETLTSVHMSFLRPTATGAEAQFMTIDLTNASVSDFVSIVPNGSDPSLAKVQEYNEISLTYQKITTTFTVGGVTATDDWEAQV
jgi:type VI secretion system secreted protein Hcp